MAAKKKTAKRKKSAAASRKTAKKSARAKSRSKSTRKKSAAKTSKKAGKKKAVAKKKTAKKKAAARPAKKKAAKKKAASKKSAKKKTVSRKSASKKPASKKAAKKKSGKKAGKKVAKKSAAKKPSKKKTASKKKAISAKKTSKKAAKAVRKPSGPVRKPVTPKSAGLKARPKKRRGSLLSGPSTEFKPYAMRRGESYMNDSQLEHFKEKLLSWKRELMEEVDRTVHHMKDEAANFPDPNDRATQESEFSLELRTRDRERKLLRKIDSALQRIKEGSYGYCEETGEEIGLQRLEARPVATLSLEAQERRELAEKQYRDDR